MAGYAPLYRSTPEDQGISSSCILDFIAQIQAKVNSLHSFMLLRHGVIIGEAWWKPYRPETPHMLYSLSKSFTSTAVGLAVAEGLLSIDDPLLKFFPTDAPETVSANLTSMTVRHLLSMSTGHHQDTTDRMIFSQDPVKQFLGLPVEHAPGTYFVYNTGASFMLSAIVQKITGQTLCDFLTPRLFDPLGIRKPYWESHPSGINFGGWGLYLTTEEIARFGQLYLQNGVWEGQQLIPDGWAKAATSKQMDNSSQQNPDWKVGYGYQFWRCRHNSYRGDGAFGQYCIVMPEQDAVLAITGGLDDMQLPLDIVWDTLLPGFQGKSKMAPGGQAQPDLFGFELPRPQAVVGDNLSTSISGKTFILEPNLVSLQFISFDFDNQTLTYRLFGEDGAVLHMLQFGKDHWVDSDAPWRFLEGTSRRASACGVWTASDTFTLAVVLYDTPFTLSLNFYFAADLVELTVQQNVTFGPLKHPAILGQLA